MAKIVNSWNDWDPLKRVIVGRCDNSMIPPEEPATSEKVPVDSEMRGMWGLRPLATVERGNECLENLVKTLEDRGVVVDLPTPLQWNQAIGTPDFRNDSMMTCMPPCITKSVTIRTRTKWIVERKASWLYLIYAYATIRTRKAL